MYNIYINIYYTVHVSASGPKVEDGCAAKWETTTAWWERCK